MSLAGSFIEFVGDVRGCLLGAPNNEEARLATAATMPRERTHRHIVGSSQIDC